MSEGGKAAGFSEEESRLAKLEQQFEETDWNDPAAAGEAAKAARDSCFWLLKRFRRTLRLADRIDLQLKSALDNEAARSTELKAANKRLTEAQNELVRAEKLAALGGMVAGIAHEVNTPLGIIRTASSSLATETAVLETKARAGQARKSEVFGYFETALEATKLIEANSARAADLIQSFKDVAVDRSSDARRPFALVPYLNEVVETLRPELKKTNLSVEIDGPEALELDGFPGGISQVATNMVVNSIRHGFEDGQSGRLTFLVEPIGETSIKMTYSDNGAGVPESLRETMFDPFVTTKRGAGGSGLGLNIVHNLIVAKMGGSIRYRETDGGGATFEMTFPTAAPG